MQIKCNLVIICVISVLLLTSCSAPVTLPPTNSSTPLTELPTPAQGDAWHLVVISESSGYGVGDAYASQIEHDLGVKVLVDNFAISDLSVGKVRQALETGKSDNTRLMQLAEALKIADIVLLFANPMDSVDQKTQGGINLCFASLPPAPLEPGAFDGYVADLDFVWAKIFELRSGQPTILRALDIASPFVGAWKSHQVFDACTAYWDGVSQALRRAAEVYHIPFVSRYEAVNGVGYNEDANKNGFIGEDGIHPNTKADELTAELLSKVGYAPVPPLVK